MSHLTCVSLAIEGLWEGLAVGAPVGSTMVVLSRVLQGQYVSLLCLLGCYVSECLNHIAFPGIHGKRKGKGRNEVIRISKIYLENSLKQAFVAAQQPWMNWVPEREARNEKGWWVWWGARGRAFFHNPV